MPKRKVQAKITKETETIKVDKIEKIEIIKEQNQEQNSLVTEKYPVILSKTPYNFNQWIDGKEAIRQYETAYDAVKRGYVYIVQNERGRFFSEGVWDILGTPTTDGYDAFTWISSQEWSNQKIGTIGCSSTAEWQMAVASLDHPAHTALVPQGFGAGVVGGNPGNSRSRGPLRADRSDRIGVGRQISRSRFGPGPR